VVVLIGLAILLMVTAGTSPPVPEIKTIPELMAQLKDDDPARRRQAAEDLGKRRTEAKEAVFALHDLLEDENPCVRIRAATALWQIDRQSEPIFAVLGESFGDSMFRTGPRPNVPQDIEAEQNAAWTAFHESLVGRLGFNLGGLKLTPSPREESDAAIFALAKGLESKNQGVRRFSVSTLAVMVPAPGTEVAIPALCHSLKDDDLLVSAMALETLGKYGPKAKQAIAPLREMLRGLSPPAVSASVAVWGWSAQPQGALLLPATESLIAFAKEIHDAILQTIRKIDPDALNETEDAVRRGDYTIPSPALLS
jgi:HEAT repeat protein